MHKASWPRLVLSPIRTALQVTSQTWPTIKMLWLGRKNETLAVWTDFIEPSLWERMLTTSGICRQSNMISQGEQECQRDVERDLSEVQNEVQGQQVASREQVVNFFLHELSQSPFEGAHYQTLYNTSRAAPEMSSEIQPLRQERDSLIHLLSQCGKNTKIASCSCFLSGANSFVERNDWSRKKKSKSLQAEVILLGAEHLQISQHLDWSKDEVTQKRCNEFWHHPEPT